MEGPNRGHGILLAWLVFISFLLLSGGSIAVLASLGKRMEPQGEEPVGQAFQPDLLPDRLPDSQAGKPDQQTAVPAAPPAPPSKPVPPPAPFRNLPTDDPPKPPPLPELPRRHPEPTTPAKDKPPVPERREEPELHWLPANIQKQVDRSIDRGIEFLRRRQNTDGSWGHLIGTAGKRYTPGITALSALTLLECGVSARDAHVCSAARYLRQSMPQLTNTYSISLAILFFDRLGDESDVARIRTLAIRLIAGQKSSGGWDYSCPKLSAEEELGLLALLYKDRPTTSVDLFAQERKREETKLDS